MPPAQILRAYVELTKPRILLLVIFTGLPVMAMAAEGWPGVPFAAVTTEPSTAHCPQSRSPRARP